jgi:hypothetical protein
MFSVCGEGGQMVSGLGEGKWLEDKPDKGQGEEV